MAERASARRGSKAAATPEQGTSEGESGNAPAPEFNRILALGQTAGNRAAARALAAQRLPANQQPVQRFRAGYAPALSAGAPAHVGGTPYTRAGFGRPNFYDDVKDAIIARMAPADIHRGADPEGRQLLWARCGRCGLLGTAGDMQIGHIQAWADYVEGTVPTDTAEATQAYNDLNNLRLEHAACNAGAGADIDDDDDDDDAYEAGPELSDNDEPLDAGGRAELDAVLAVLRRGALAPAPGGAGGGFGQPVRRELSDAERDALEGPEPDDIDMDDGGGGGGGDRRR